MNIDSESSIVDVGLYVHVAFCRTKCYYCDFNTYAHLDGLIPSYVEALEREVASLPHALPETPRAELPRFRIGSIFFGGGTPSLLTPEQIASILRTTRQWEVAPDAEVTIEANPDDRSLAYYAEIRHAGVNRLSLGAQSFDDALLQRLGRRHDAAAVADAVRLARAAGFENLSLDLMFALPDQTLDGWRDSVERALALGPEHLSLYNLTVEPETPFDAWQAAGKLVVPDDDCAADMYQLAIERLGAAGYHHYEISNWARRDPTRDLRAQHNLRYWRNQPYFGVGAGAHSSFGGFRYANLRAPGRYIARLKENLSPIETAERIGRETEQEETMMLGLRLAEGIRDADFRARFGTELRAAYGEVLDELLGYGLIAWEEDDHGARVCLTQRGRFLGNEVFCRFLLA